MLVLASVGLLAACDTNGEEEAEPPEEVEEEQEEQEEELEEPEEDEIEELAFVPQVSDEAVDFTPEDSDITQYIAEFVEENNEELGEVGEISVDLSNEIVYPESQADLRGIVLVSNRTDEPISNFGFDVTIESDDGTVFVEEYSLFLTEEHFGVLEPNTVMPVYVEVDPQYIEELAQTAIEQTGFAEGTNFITDEDVEGIPEDSGLGYNPIYIAELSQQEAGTEPSAEPVEGGTGEYEMLVPEGDPHLTDNPSNLANLQMISDQYASMVQEYEQNWMDMWTGMVSMDGDGESMVGYFMLVNDTGEDFRNLSFTLGLMDQTNDVMIFEDMEITLSEEDYGIWEDGTVMPFSVEIPEDAYDEVMVLMEGQAQGIPVTENLEYEPVDE